MAQVNISKRPQGFRLMPEGQNVLKITKAEGTPRTNVTNVEVSFVDAEGITLKNRYDLTIDGGYAAFYYLATIGCEFDADTIDINDMVGRYVTVEIVHNEGSRPLADGRIPVFANIKTVTGPGAPFDEDEAEDDGSDPWG